MKRFQVIAAVFLTAAAGALAVAHPAAATNGKLACKASGISLQSVGKYGVKVAVKAACKLPGRKAPVPYTTSWKASFSDLSHQPCNGFAPMAGHGKSFNLPQLPTIVQVTFTVMAKWGKQVAKASKTLPRVTPDSHVFCGAPPKLVSLPGATPSACTWGINPGIGGQVVYADGSIECVGLGQCRWNKPNPHRYGSYYVMEYGFSCSGGYTGYVRLTMGYRPQGSTAAECLESFQSSSLVISPQWGPGLLYPQAYVVTLSGNAQLPYLPASVWWPENEAVPASGRVDPCKTGAWD